MKGHLNLFQAAMLRWRAAYPYNAVHVAQLPGPLDAARMSRAIDGYLTDAGIGRLRIDAERRCYEYLPGPSHADLPVLEAKGDTLEVLEREMERLLNVTFGDGEAFSPVRFFAVEDAAARGASFHLGVAYDHIVAGGDSVVALLKEIAARYDGSQPADWRAPEIYPSTYAGLFARNALKFYIGQYLLPGMLLRAGRAYRPRYPHGEGRHNAFTSFELPPHVHAAMARAAKAWGVTRNDLMLAMMLCAISPEVEARRGEGRRNEIAIASVINLRREIAGPPHRVFGQFLSSFMVTHPVPQDATLEALARDVHEQTDRVKRRKLYLQTLFLLACGGLAWRFMTPEQHKHMDAKNHPVWAGLSALNVEAIWNGVPGKTPVLHYLRAVSTGPVAPIVVAPASVGEGLSVGVSYRTSAFTREDIERINERVMSCARRLAA
ncbi:MAG: hypothetical protein U1F54_14385 [Burkholderiales bacterium]